MYSDMLEEGKGFVERLEVEVFWDIYDIKWGYNIIMNIQSCVKYSTLIYTDLVSSFLTGSQVKLETKTSWLL